MTDGARKTAHVDSRGCVGQKHGICKSFRREASRSTEQCIQQIASGAGLSVAIAGHSDRGHQLVYPCKTQRGSAESLPSWHGPPTSAPPRPEDGRRSGASGHAPAPVTARGARCRPERGHTGTLGARPFSTGTGQCDHLPRKHQRARLWFLAEVSSGREKARGGDGGPWPDRTRKVCPGGKRGETDIGLGRRTDPLSTDWARRVCGDGVAVVHRRLSTHVAIEPSGSHIGRESQ